jgi:hypothetical protein
MAPEVWENKFSTHSDQFSLAVTYVELRIGRRVFKSKNFLSLMDEIRKGEVDLAPLESAEQRVIRRALRQDPHQRYPTCTAFAQALEAVFRPPPPPAPKRSGLLPVVALLACLIVVGLVYVIASSRTPSRPACIYLPDRLEEEVRVDTGGMVTFYVPIERENYGGPVQFIPEEDIEDVSVKAEAREGEAFATVSVWIDHGAKPGPHRIHLRTADETLKGRTSFDLTVFYLPPDFKKAEDAEPPEEDVQKVKYYKRISRRLGAQEVVFVLVPQEKSQGGVHRGEVKAKTFYISRDKITRGQFAAYLAQHPDRVPGERWKLHADDHERVPVRDVKVEEAYNFAVWLGGHLPTSEQWDKAAGRYRRLRPKGPYQGPHVAIGLERPCRVDAPEDADDESVYHCRGMAGNGFEWTRNGRNGEMVPLRAPGGLLDAPIILRAWNFEFGQPLSFEDLEGVEGTKLPAWPYQKPDPAISFRVVLEPNG